MDIVRVLTPIFKEKIMPEKKYFRASLDRNRGFSLMELTIVIAIIVVLAAIVVPSGLRILERSRLSALAVDLATIKTAAIEYYADNGAWPADEADFTEVAADGGAYLNRWPTVPWQGATIHWDSDIPVVEVRDLPEGKAEKLLEILGGEVLGNNYTLSMR